MKGHCAGSLVILLLLSRKHYSWEISQTHYHDWASFIIPEEEAKIQQNIGNDIQNEEKVAQVALIERRKKNRPTNKQGIR